MKKLSLSLLAVATSLVLALPSLSASSATAASTASATTAASDSFRREPIIVYTFEQVTASGPQSVSLVVYQDGYTAASRRGDAGQGTPDNVVSGNVGELKAQGWFYGLTSAGAAHLPDGPTPDPTGAGAATLSVFEPATNAWSGDYPRIESTMQAILLRINV